MVHAEKIREIKMSENMTYADYEGAFSINITAGGPYMIFAFSTNTIS